jgi:hypothetical protein
MNEFWREADVIGSAKPKSPNGYSAHHHHVGRATKGHPSPEGWPFVVLEEAQGRRCPQAAE